MGLLLFLSLFTELLMKTAQGFSKAKLHALTPGLEDASAGGGESTEAAWLAIRL